MKLWLDDRRKAPGGWTHVTNIEDAKVALRSGAVESASLDHDLGACETCMGGQTVEEWFAAHAGQAMPHCDHVGTGYDLCLWMTETGQWPKTKPGVHSLNPIGAARMRGVIDRYGPYN